VAILNSSGVVVPGFGEAECAVPSGEAVSGDGVSVRWAAGRASGPRRVVGDATRAGEVIRLRFTLLGGARLYSFQVAKS
jgi:hypothetical protein